MSKQSNTIINDSTRPDSHLYILEYSTQRSYNGRKTAPIRVRIEIHSNLERSALSLENHAKYALRLSHFAEVLPNGRLKDIQRPWYKVEVREEES